MAGMLSGPGFLRLALAMAVMVEHVSRLQVGSPAVMAFFMLSGYWVARMLDEKYSRAPHPLAAFWISRGLRIWLPYLAAMLLAMAGFAALLGRHDPAHWLALPLLGTASHARDVIGIAWSLDIELQFYLLLPLLWAALVRARRGAPGRGGLLAGIAGGVAALTALGWALDFGAGIRTALSFLPLFAAGAAIHAFGIRASGRAAAASAAAFGLAGAAIWAIPATRPFLIWGSGDFAADNLFAMGWTVLLIPFLAWNVRQESGRLDRHLGNLSYSVYLLHYPAIGILAGLLGRDMTDAEKLAFLILAPAAAALFYLAIDRPADRLRQRLVRRFLAPA